MYKTRQQMRQARRRQRFYGVLLILIALLVLVMAALGSTPQERDATPSLLLGPLGLYLCFSRSLVIA